MKIKSYQYWKTAFTVLGALLLAGVVQAQTVTNPVPNLAISWNLDSWSTVNPTDLTGLAPATNWVDTYLNNITSGLPDNTGASTTLNLTYHSYNTYQVYSSHVGADANGTKNKEMLNGFLNAGPAAWSPYITNTFVTLTNIPYSTYDVIVYFNSDTSGRHASIDNGSTTYYFSTMGSAAVNTGNALFTPTTQTNSAIFPGADFAFFPGMTNPNAVFTEQPKSGNDQWLGIAGFQVIQASNAYVAYGPSPTSQIVPLGKPTSFNIMAGGLNPVYQWQHAGTNIANATNATYNIAATATGQDGNYDVVVANSFGSVTSAVATLSFYNPKLVEWDGNGGTWDATSLFWTLNGGSSTTNYTETDNVLFDPLGAAQSTVSLSGAFIPSSITVSNASYVLTSGGLNGSSSLRVRNNGTLILDTPDTSTGPILVDSGSTLQLDSGDTAGSLGSGAFTNNGALLFAANGSEAYGYPVYGTGSITNLSTSGTITLGNNITGNYLAQSGAGSLLLQGSNSLTGGLVISSGAVWARSVGALGNAPVLITGGELQLNFSIDYMAPSLTLSGGTLHGVGGNSIFEGIVALTTDSQLNVDNGSSLTLNNPAGISGGSFNLTQGNNPGTIILNGTNNTWGSYTINTGTLQIGSGAKGSVGGGTVTVFGNLAFDLSGNLVVTNPVTGSGNLNQFGSGTTYFTGDLSGLGGNVTATVGGLGGTTTIGGPVSITPGATLVPGTASAIGTLTLNGGLTLGGNVSVKVNKALSQTSDLIAGSVNNTNNGTVTVNNLGTALAPGDTFTLFNQPVTGGATLAISGGGVTWSNNLATDGTIIVLSTVASYSTNITTSVSGGTLTIQWPSTHIGWILQSQTNSLGAGLSTNWVDVAGSSAVTSESVTINASAPSVFYRLRHP